MGSLEPTSLRSIAPESVSTFKLLKLPIDSGSEMFIPQPFPLSIINFSNFFKFPISLGRSSKFSRQEISNSTKLIRVPNCDGRCSYCGVIFRYGESCRFFRCDKSLLKAVERLRMHNGSESDTHACDD